MSTKRVTFEGLSFDREDTPMEDRPDADINTTNTAEAPSVTPPQGAPRRIRPERQAQLTDVSPRADAAWAAGQREHQTAVQRSNQALTQLGPGPFPVTNPQQEQLMMADLNNESYPIPPGTTVMHPIFRTPMTVTYPPPPPGYVPPQPMRVPSPDRAATTHDAMAGLGDHLFGEQGTNTGLLVTLDGLQTGVPEETVRLTDAEIAPMTAGQRTQHLQRLGFTVPAGLFGPGVNIPGDGVMDVVRRRVDRLLVANAGLIVAVANVTEMLYLCGWYQSEEVAAYERWTRRGLLHSWLTERGRDPEYISVDALLKILRYWNLSIRPPGYDATLEERNL